MDQSSKDPLHGKRLDTILEELLEYYKGYGMVNWESKLTSNVLRVKIRVFLHL